MTNKSGDDERKKLESKDLANRVYIGAVVFLVAAILLNALWPLFSDGVPMTNRMSNTLAVLFIGVCTFGVFIEGTPIVKLFWQHWSRPYVFGATFLLTARVGIELAEFVINAYVRESPSHFTATTWTVGGMLGFATWLLLGVVFSLVLSFFSVLFSFLNGESKWWQFVGRFLGFIGLAAVFWHSTFVTVAVSDKVTIPILVYADYYTYSSCSNHNHSEGERVAFLDGNRISVATLESSGSYSFQSRVCLPDN